MTAIKADSKKGTIKGADCFMPAIITITAAATINAREAAENEFVMIRKSLVVG